MQIKTGKEGKRRIFIMKPKLSRRSNAKYVQKLYAVSRGLNKSTIKRLSEHRIDLTTTTFFEMSHRLDNQNEIIIKVYRTTVSVAKEVMNYSSGFVNYE